LAVAALVNLVAVRELSGPHVTWTVRHWVFLAVQAPALLCAHRHGVYLQAQRAG
jgi:hypothetical protein